MNRAAQTGPAGSGGLSRLDVLRGLRISMGEGVWSTVFAVLTTGAFQIGFALYLGASPFWIGLLAGLPAAVGLLQIPASLYVERRGERKRFVATAALLGRLLWLPILLGPLVLPAPARLPAFVVLLALSSALLTITVPAWTSWMSDLVPADNRGRFFAQRNMLAGIVTVLVPVPAGAFLDQAVRYNRFDPRLGFAALFGVACIAALVGGGLLLRQPEPVRAPAQPASPLQSLSAPLGDANFRAFIVFAGLLVMGQTLAGQFFTAWQVSKDALNLPYLTVQLLSAVASGAGLATIPLWGYLSDKYGSRPVLAMGCAGTVLAPFLWILTVPKPDAFWLNVAVIVTLNLFSGVAWAGVGLSQFNLLLSLAPDAARGTYVAMFSALTGIVGGVSPIVGGALMAALATTHLPLGPLTLNNYKILFALAGFLRIACLLLLRRVAEPEGRSTRYVLDQLRQARPVTSWLTARRLSRPSQEGERRETIGKLADLGSPLAVEELVAALDDVSPRVREDAVRALGEIGDARAVPPLVAKLDDPAAHIGDLAADALGAIGDPSAVVPLTKAAAGPDALVRVAAIRTLGRLGDARAVPALLRALAPNQPASAEVACASLSALASQISTPVAREGIACLLPLLAPDAERGIRLAAARAIEALAPNGGGDEAWDRLAAALTTEADPAVAAQEAGALARLAASRPPAETLAQLLPLLDRTATAPLAFKQALGAIAQVGLPGGEFYPFLGLSDMARDETIHKLLEELRRLLRARPTPKKAARTVSGERPDALVARALDAYLAGRFADCVHVLADLSRRLPGTSETSERAAATLRALASRASAGPETALLGALLLRTTLST